MFSHLLYTLHPTNPPIPDDLKPHFFWFALNLCVFTCAAPELNYQFPESRNMRGNQRLVTFLEISVYLHHPGIDRQTQIAIFSLLLQSDLFCKIVQEFRFSPMVLCRLNVCETVDVFGCCDQDKRESEYVYISADSHDIFSIHVFQGVAAAVSYVPFTTEEVAQLGKDFCTLLERPTIMWIKVLSLYDTHAHNKDDGSNLI